MSLPNPYSAGGIVKDPLMFYGRKEEMSRIRDRLHKGDSTAIVGLQRIGKSSLLYQLAHRVDRLPERAAVVYLDLQDGAHHRPLDLLTSALCRLDELLNNRYSFPSVDCLGTFSECVKRVAADGFQPVLCLDEIEQLTDRDAFDDSFFESLRSLGNQRVLAYVTASQESLDLLLKRNRRTSPFYNLFICLELGGLTHQAVQGLLVEPFQRAGLNPPPEDYRAEVVDLAGHYPFYLQMAASSLYALRRESTFMDRDALRKAFTRDAEYHFRGLWRHLTPDEQAGVKRLSGGRATVPDWHRTLDHLLRCGLAEGDVDDARLFSSVFSEMIKTGDVHRDHVRQPERTGAHVSKAERAVIPPLFAYALVALGSAVISLLISLFLTPHQFWFFFAILSVVLTFVLVLADKLSGEHLLKLVSSVLGKWKP